MNFGEFERVKYEHNILFDLTLQADFPDIVKISQEDPGEFQDILRKNGYPEYHSDPLETEELENALSEEKVFRFLSADKGWQILLTKSAIALGCSRNYINYEDHRERFKTVLELFREVYEPSYFTHVALRHRNIANKTFLPHVETDIKDFIPAHIFPELSAPLASSIKRLQKASEFNEGDLNARIIHVFSEMSGTFGNTVVENDESYIIDMVCFVEKNMERTDDILSRCDRFTEITRDIFEWSITDKLREVMGISSS